MKRGTENLYGIVVNLPMWAIFPLAILTLQPVTPT
jgi:hypothetical protein